MCVANFLRGVEVSGETVLEVVGDKPQKPDPSSLQLTPADGECVILYPVNTTHSIHTIVIVIHAYDVSLRASKEKEQQLQSQLATVEQESQDKEQQLLKLEDRNYDLHKKMLSLKYENEQQQKELKRLQQKSKTYY